MIKLRNVEQKNFMKVKDRSNNLIWDEYKLIENGETHYGRL